MASQTVPAEELRAAPLSDEPPLSVRMAIGAASLLLITVLYLLVAWLLGLVIPASEPPDAAAIQRLFASSAGAFVPERLERLRYLLGMGMFPTGLLAFNFIGFRLARTHGAAFRRTLWPVAAGSFFLCLVAAYMAFGHADFFVQGASLVSRPVWVLLAAVAATVWALRPRRQSSRRLAWILSILPLGYAALVSSISVFTVNKLVETFTYMIHFNAVFHAVSQVYLGKALLVDLVNQYGLYPHFLEPLFRLTGLTVGRFTLVMALLTLVSYACGVFVLFRALRSRLLATIASIAVTYYGSTFIAVSLPEERYFQYVPIRTLFPCLLLFGAALYFWSQSPRLRRLLGLALTALSAAAVLWNLDSGAVVFVGWTAALAYDTLRRRPDRQGLLAAVGQVCLSLLVLAAVVAAYCGYISLRYGHAPNILSFFLYQGIFYIYGFYMLPMPLFNPWNMCILTYVVGMLYAIQAFLTGQRQNSLASMVFLLSLYGVGIFSYYQGRSHDYNLFHVCYLAIMLVAIFLDRLALLRPRGQGLRWIQRLAMLLGMVVLANGTLSAMETSPAMVALVRHNRAIAKGPSDSVIPAHSRFIGAHTHPGESVLILSLDAGPLYLGTSTTCPLNIPGTGELLLNSDFKKIRDYCQSPGARVFYDTNMFAATYPDAINRVTEALLRHMRPVAHSADNQVVLYEALSPSQQASAPSAWLDASEHRVFHAVLDPQSQLLKVECPKSPTLHLPIRFLGLFPVSFAPNFTFEALVRPQASQQPNDTLVSIEPAGVPFQGLQVQRGPQGGNRFELDLGTGTSWFQAAEFDLAPDTWHFVAVVGTGKMVRSYVDGREVKGVAFSNLATGSAMPLTIGNSVNAAQPFQGDVQEFGLRTVSTPARDIQETWRRVGAAIGGGALQAGAR